MSITRARIIGAVVLVVLVAGQAQGQYAVQSPSALRVLAFQWKQWQQAFDAIHARHGVPAFRVVWFDDQAQWYAVSRVCLVDDAVSMGLTIKDEPSVRFLVTLTGTGGAQELVTAAAFRALASRGRVTHALGMAIPVAAAGVKTP